jgi:hypothetical protein
MVLPYEEADSTTGEWGERSPIRILLVGIVRLAEADKDRATVREPSLSGLAGVIVKEDIGLANPLKVVP